MKNSIKSILATLVLAISVVAKGESSNNEQLPIELTRTEKKETIVPRTPSYIPIECIYNYGTLEFSFFEDLGEISISITNLTNGQCDTAPIDTSVGYTIINVSQNSGEYMIVISSTTTEYYGYYEL